MSRVVVGGDLEDPDFDHERSLMNRDLQLPAKLSLPPGQNGEIVLAVAQVLSPGKKSLSKLQVRGRLTTRIAMVSSRMS